MGDDIERFKIARAVLEDVDADGNGERLEYDRGLWRAVRLKEHRQLGVSSGSWNSAGEAISALGNRKGECKDK